MSDNVLNTEPADPSDLAQAFSGTNDNADADDDRSARARAQRRIAHARISAADATARARAAAAAARRTANPTAETDGVNSSTLGERAQAYRAHILSAAAAIAAALFAVGVRHRAAGRHADTTIDLGEWQLHAEPTDK